MNKITLCIFIALIVLVASVASFTNAQQEPVANKSALLRDLARKLYPNATDRQIIKKLFPRIKLGNNQAVNKLVDTLVNSLSDSAAGDCARYCAGSTGSYKISCYQHCQRYGL